MKISKVLKSAVVGAMLMLPTFAYGQAYGTVATETLNVRSGAKLEASIVKQVGLGEPVEIVSQQGDWLKIILADDKRAYVKAEYINVHRVLAVVDVNDGLNVRDYPSTENGNIIGRFVAGDEISVLCRVGDWYKVSQEGFEGFVHKDYVKNSSQVDFLSYLPTTKLTQVRRMTMTQEEAMAIMVEAEEAEKAQEEANNAANESNDTSSSSNTASNNSTGSSSSSNKKPSSSSSNTSSKPNKKPSSSSSSTGSATGQAIVEYAKQFLGNPYVYGGNSLTNGVDCSGFTSQIMKHFGISLNRSSASQYANNGYHVSSDNLQAGDLLFYGYSGQVSHVAIYIGGGQIIHANDERTGICIGNAFPSRGKKYIGAKRVI
ncbi:MAG: C40 family peptidase [Cellulosilyticum sp.]|nr:C40 family peptidase [Cellulosilyticum sp.]